MGGELEPKLKLELELEPNQGNETLRERNFSIWQRKLPRELTHTHIHTTHISTHTHACISWCALKNLRDVLPLFISLYTAADAFSNN